jgi:hypothetical protein
VGIGRGRGGAKDPWVTAGSGSVQYIRDSAKREEREDGVEKITAEAFVPFIKQRRRERLFARQTVGIHNNLLGERYTKDNEILKHFNG